MQIKKIKITYKHRDRFQIVHVQMIENREERRENRKRERENYEK